MHSNRDPQVDPDHYARYISDQLPEAGQRELAEVLVAAREQGLDIIDTVNAVARRYQLPFPPLPPDLANDRNITDPAINRGRECALSLEYDCYDAESTQSAHTLFVAEGHWVQQLVRDGMRATDAWALVEKMEKEWDAEKRSDAPPEPARQPSVGPLRVAPAPPQHALVAPEAQLLLPPPAPVEPTPPRQWPKPIIPDRIKACQRLGHLTPRPDQLPDWRRGI